MDPLDNPTQIPNPNSISFWPTVIRYGLIGAGVSIVFSLISQLTGLGYPNTLGKLGLIMLTAIIISVLIAKFTIAHHRDNELSGFISFGRAFIVSFVALGISMIISSIYTYLYVAYIDPEIGARMLEATAELMESFGAPEEEIERQLEATREQMTPWGMIKTNFLNGGIANMIICLIVSAVMKKEIPE